MEIVNDRVELFEVVSETAAGTGDHIMGATFAGFVG